MKYKVCDKCDEIVTKTGVISSSSVSDENSRFARCNNQSCQKYFSKARYEKLNEKEL